MADISLIPKDYKKGTKFLSTSSKIELTLTVLTILALVALGGLFFYQRNLTGQLTDLKEKDVQLDNQRDKVFENKVLGFEETLKNLKVALKDHTHWSRLLTLVENSAVPQVSFSTLAGSIKADGSLTLNLEGTAAGFTYLAKQLASLAQEEAVLDLETSKIRLGSEKGVDFSLIIKLANSILLE